MNCAGERLWHLAQQSRPWTQSVQVFPCLIAILCICNVFNVLALERGNLLTTHFGVFSRFLLNCGSLIIIKTRFADWHVGAGLDLRTTWFQPFGKLNPKPKRQNLLNHLLIRIRMVSSALANRNGGFPKLGAPFGVPIVGLQLGPSILGNHESIKSGPRSIHVFCSSSRSVSWSRMLGFSCCQTVIFSPIGCF